MTDLKHYGLHRRDIQIDSIATGIAWIMATVLLILYGLGAMP